MWISIYEHKEAAIGQGPLEVVDSGPGSPINLTINYVTGGWTDIPAGRGLDGIAFVAGLEAGNKLYDALNGSTTYTVEAVVGSIDGIFSMLPWLMTVADGETPFTGYVTDTGAMGWFSENNSAGFASGESAPGLITTGVYVLHWVWQSTAAVQDRVRIYINGVRIVHLNYTPPDDSATLEPGASLDLTNNVEFGNYTGAVCYWAALADHAAADAEILFRALALAANNDVDPSGDETMIRFNQSLQLLNVGNVDVAGLVTIAAPTVVRSLLFFHPDALITIPSLGITDIPSELINLLPINRYFATDIAFSARLTTGVATVDGVALGWSAS